jgi:hypothetical protein
VQLTGALCKEPIIEGESSSNLLHGPTTIEQAEDKIRALVDLVSDAEDSPFNAPWVHCGCKRDVPPCVCYVGHYHGCKGDMYAWVLPEDAKTLREFILVVLSLVPPDAQEAAAPRLGIGAANSPNF